MLADDRQFQIAIDSHYNRICKDLGKDAGEPWQVNQEAGETGPHGMSTDLSGSPWPLRRSKEM